jgi:hypothetical protein
VIHQTIAKFIVSLVVGMGCTLILIENNKAEDARMRILSAVMICAIAAMWL